MKIFSYEEFTEGRKVPKMKDFDTVAGMLKSLINARDDEWLKAAAFFGSFVFKCHNVGSDIDLLIISDGLISIDRENFLRSLSRMASSYNISLDILLLSESDINPKRITYCNAGDMLAAFRFLRVFLLSRATRKNIFPGLNMGVTIKSR
jgi:predicted nucleotidyltransferase